MNWLFKLAEKIMWSFVVALRLFTSWYVVVIWSFLFPYLMGESIFFSIAFCAVATYTTYMIWHGSENEQPENHVH